MKKLISITLLLISYGIKSQTASTANNQVTQIGIARNMVAAISDSSALTVKLFTVTSTNNAGAVQSGSTIGQTANTTFTLPGGNYEFVYGLYNWTTAGTHIDLGLILISGTVATIADNATFLAAGTYTNFEVDRYLATINQIAPFTTIMAGQVFPLYTSTVTSVRNAMFKVAPSSTITVVPFYAAAGTPSALVGYRFKLVFRRID